MFNIFCCKRKNLKIPKTQNEIKLDLNVNKNSQSIEINQSQSLSMISNNLNNSTKDNILQKQNRFNIVNHINDDKFENKNKINQENIKNVVYNIINVDNINNINNNKKFFGIKRNNNYNTKIKDDLKGKSEEIFNEDLNEREKKLFENQKELSNKENEINKIIDIIKLNKRMNTNKSKKPQKNNLINDIIKFKKQDFEKIENENSNKIKENDSKK